MAQFYNPAVATDTIVAVSTPQGAGAIAIVRLSGTEARAIVGRLCPAGVLPPAESHKLVVRRLVDGSGEVLDEALVAWMQAPHSFTGEDVVELHLHGSPAVVEATVAACLAAGARQAEPGEFTRRAFLTGRLDLAQAEGIGALVGAETEQQRQAALQLVDGQLGRSLAPLLHRVEGVVAAWRAALDFPDEVVAEAGLPAAKEALAWVTDALQRLVANAQPLRAAVPQVVLLGDANVGKSTLLNALAGEERALVDAVPGTTRDAVSHAHAVGKIRFTVWDTAGLRAEAEGVEARGVALAEARAARADVRLWLTGAKGDSWPTGALANDVLVVGSQADRIAPAARAQIEAEARRRKLPFVGWICAPDGEGLAALEQALATKLTADSAAAAASARTTLTRRHHGLLTEAFCALQACTQALADDVPLDLVLADLERAAERLGQVVGRDVDAAALDRIFADFCLGK